MYHEVEKKSFAFSHCWIILNGKPKWNQLVANLKSDKKRNDGSSSHQSIGLDDEEDDVVIANERATVPRITDKSWETSGRRHGPPVAPRLQKCRPHGRAFFDKGE